MLESITLQFNDALEGSVFRGEMASRKHDAVLSNDRYGVTVNVGFLAKPTDEVAKDVFTALKKAHKTATKRVVRK